MFGGGRKNAASIGHAPRRVNRGDYTDGLCVNAQTRGLQQFGLIAEGEAQQNLSLANSEFAVISIHVSKTNCRNPSIF
jgi:hypothetical protein